MSVLWPNGSTSIPTVTSEYGPRVRPIAGVKPFHEGIDLKGFTHNHAAVDGLVTYSAELGSYGLLVILRGDNGDEYRYAHNDVLLVRHGQRVKQGDRVGVLGSTGAATGPHCHYEVRPLGRTHVNPRIYMDAANTIPTSGGVQPFTTDKETDDMLAIIVRGKGWFGVWPQGSGKPVAVAIPGGNEAAASKVPVLIYNDDKLYSALRGVIVGLPA